MQNRALAGGGGSLVDLCQEFTEALNVPMKKQ